LIAALRAARRNAAAISRHTCQPDSIESTSPTAFFALLCPFPPKLCLPHSHNAHTSHRPPPLTTTSPRSPVRPPTTACYVLREYLVPGSDHAQNPSTRRNTCLSLSRPKAPLCAHWRAPPHLTVLTTSLPNARCPSAPPSRPADDTCSPPHPHAAARGTAPSVAHTVIYHVVLPRLCTTLWSRSFLEPTGLGMARRPARDTRRLALPVANLPRRAQRAHDDLRAPRPCWPVHSQGPSTCGAWRDRSVGSPTGQGAGNKRTASCRGRPP
jgi:hypothetical protein